jgi:hypothetical protein
MFETQQRNLLLHLQAVRDILMATREVVLKSYAVINFQYMLCSQQKKEANWQIILPQQAMFFVD